ncbi:DNA-binding transcriptional regulator, AcrR family [Amycolatopsis lurida]|uniref:TetR family transcriptional regulator n=1 Tax=Amycolatopsis lurida NRRL 2430 TaxID=1460371 RepID=A0A2P2FKD0_AMYLU|nr:TetR family transcriptional regulator [Amycolatopsis lurida]KFU77186.1 TetR family transcriptional regulator [Amycolatopsis lurida NRRL 2430]SEE48403.1 DNA-binding transcriptional regulator, AcrR family [Amycolatopsis lurida]
MAQAGRRPGQTETREEILDAARRKFAEQGYDGATVRGIAAEAGVNAALLHHFFGTKQRLFAASMNLPVDPGELVPRILEGPEEEIGERLVRAFLGLWQAPDGRAPFLAMIRSATTNEQVATMMRQFLERAVLARVAEARGVPKVRVAGIAAQMIGFALLRYVIGLPPLVNASEEEIVAMLAPVAQYYLTPGAEKVRLPMHHQGGLARHQSETTG